MKNKQWKVVRTCELNAPVEKVWDTVGGFFTIHKWHPDIHLTEIGSNQTSIRQLRRILTFPGQPKTVEELVYMDNANWYYTYKWYKGDWGERIKRYHAEIRVIELEAGKRCLVQWTGHFYYTEDALTQFYENGFDSLRKKFN